MKLRMDARAQNYEVIWKEIIEPSLKYVIENNANYKIKENSKSELLAAYKTFNDLCRTKYMLDPNKILDRHKVATCYIYAVIKVEPIITDFIPLENDTFSTINEKLAIMVGLSVLKAFCDNDLNDINFGTQFIYPTAMHGNYYENFAVELYFTKTENNYNILSLSHTLYLLEMYNRQYWKLKQLRKE